MIDVKTTFRADVYSSVRQVNKSRSKQRQCRSKPKAPRWALLSSPPVIDAIRTNCRHNCNRQKRRPVRMWPRIGWQASSPFSGQWVHKAYATHGSLRAGRAFLRRVSSVLRFGVFCDLGSGAENLSSSQLRLRRQPVIQRMTVAPAMPLVELIRTKPDFFL